MSIEYVIKLKMYNIIMTMHKIVIMAQSIPSLPIPPGDLSGICHLVSPGSWEFVRKPLLGGGAFVNSSESDN